MSRISLVNEDKAHSSIAFTTDGPVTSGQLIELTQSFEIKKDFRASANDVLLVDTRTGAVTIFLPTAPADGTLIRIIDGYNTFGLNSVKLDGGDKNVDGVETFAYLSDGLVIDVTYTSGGWVSSIFYSGSAGEDTPTISSGDTNCYERSVRTLQRYDFDSNGNYIVSGYTASYMYDDGDYHILRIAPGVAHVKGVECISNSDKRVLVRRALDFNTVRDEPASFTTNGWYTLRWAPIKSIDSINSVKQDTAMILRGPTGGGSDLLPNTPVSSILTVRYEASPGAWTVYQAGVHYVKAGDYIDWQNIVAPAGQPPAGATYEVTYQYQDSITATISADLTQIYVADLAPNSVFFVTYDFYIPRIDRLVLTKESELLIVGGNPNALYPSTPYVADHLPLAKLYLVYNQAPVIEFDYLRIAKASDIQAMLARLNYSEYNIARLALHADVQIKDPSSQLIHQFVDNFVDTDLKDMGRRNDLVAIHDQLELPVTWTQSAVRFGDNIHLAYSEYAFVSQLAESTTHRVEPYLFAEASLPIPEPIPETFVAVMSGPSVTEGNSGSKFMVFQIALDKPPVREPVTFSYRTLDTGTATPNDDFSPVAGAITFAPGQSFGSISVPIIGDVIDEGNLETVHMLLTGGRLLADVTSIGTIIDDDDPSVDYILSAIGPTVIEGDSGNASLTFHMVLNRPPAGGQSLVVNYATTLTGTATVVTDFTAASGTVTFGAGISTGQVTVVVKGDTDFEEDETVIMSFTTADASGWDGEVIATGIILNDDELPVVVPPPVRPAQLTIIPKTYSHIDAVIWQTLSRGILMYSTDRQKILDDAIALGGTEADLVSFGSFGSRAWTNRNWFVAGRKNVNLMDAYLASRSGIIEEDITVSGTRIIPTTVQISVSGRHYKSGEIVDIFFDNIEVARAITVGEDPANEFSGTFSGVTFNVPDRQGFGTKIIRGIGRTSNRTAQEVFTATITGKIMKRMTFTRLDPIAQTFIPSTNNTITSFEAIFTSTPSTFAIAKLCETTVGFPDDTKVLTWSIVEPENIVVNGWTKFVFNDPILLTANQEYSIMLECLDPDVMVRTAKMGQWDRVNGRWLTSQPYLQGVLFDSSTSTTWVSYQDEDLTFKLNAGEFNLTKSVVLTTNGAISPLDTPDGTLYRVDAVNVTDIWVMADVTLPETTQILFEITLNRAQDNVFIVASRAPIIIDSYTGTITVRALLSSTHSAITPTLGGDIYIGLGVVAQEAMYTSRAFNCSGGTTIKSYVTVYEPAGSSIVMQYLNIAVKLSDGQAGKWTRSTTNNELYYYTGIALERAPENVYLDNNEQDIVAIGVGGALVTSGKWAWGDIDSIGNSTVYVWSTLDPDGLADGYVEASAFFDMTRTAATAVGYDYFEATYSATITGLSMTTAQVRIIGATTSPIARPIAKDLRVLIQDLT